MRVRRILTMINFLSEVWKLPRENERFVDKYFVAKWSGKMTKNPSRKGVSDVFLTVGLLFTTRCVLFLFSRLLALWRFRYVCLIAPTIQRYTTGKVNQSHRMRLYWLRYQMLTMGILSPKRMIYNSRRNQDSWKLLMTTYLKEKHPAD